MKVILKLWIVLTMVVTVSAWAHGDVQLTSSIPADNAMMMQSPDLLALTYSKPLRLMKVTLTNKNGEKIDFGFKPASKKQAEYAWKLPALTPDTYTVEWIAMGGDGHKMKATYSFMVH